MKDGSHLLELLLRMDNDILALTKGGVTASDAVSSIECVIRGEPPPVWVNEES
jgi:hypothetical protein